jgi:hypothetical protein
MRRSRMMSSRQRVLFTLAVLGAVVLAAQPVFSQGEKPRPAESRRVEKKPAPPMDPTMQKWMELNRPGPQHELLKPMVGVWDAKAKFWMAPGAPPTESGGVMTNTAILDGRFIHEEYRSDDMMGMNFHGVGFFGYDNIKKQFVGTWMDSMSTGVMVSQGAYDPATKTFTLTSEVEDPIQGGKYTEKQVSRIVDHDHMTYEMYRVGADGAEIKEGEITYTRRPAKTMGKSPAPPAKSEMQ